MLIDNPLLTVAAIGLLTGLAVAGLLYALMILSNEQEVRINVVGIDLKGLIEPLDRHVQQRARFRLATLPVVDTTETPRSAVLV